MMIKLLARTQNRFNRLKRAAPSNLEVRRVSLLFHQRVLLIRLLRVVGHAPIVVLLIGPARSVLSVVLEENNSSLIALICQFMKVDPIAGPLSFL